MSNPEFPNLESEVTPEIREKNEAFAISYIRDPDGTGGGRYRSALEAGGEDFAEAASEGTLSYVFTSQYSLIKEMASKEKISQADIGSFWEKISHGGRHRSYLDPIPKFKKLNTFMSDLFAASQTNPDSRPADFPKLFSEASSLREEFNIRGSGYVSFGEKCGISEEKLLRNKFKDYIKELTGYLGSENGWSTLVRLRAKMVASLTDEARNLSIKIVDSFDSEDYDFEQMKKDFESVIAEVRSASEREVVTNGISYSQRDLEEMDHFFSIINDR